MLRLLAKNPDETIRMIERQLGWGCWTWDLRSNEMEWSRGYYDLLGLEPGTVTPSFATIQHVTHPEDRPRQAEIEHIIREASSIRRQFRVIQPGGRIIWILCQIMVLVTPKGESDKALGVCADVTALEDELKPLRTADERYRTLITRAKGAIFWAARADGQVYEIPSWKNMRTEPTDSALQWRWIEFLHPDDRERTVVEWREAVARRQVFETEYRFRQVDGSFKWRRVQAMPILDGEANVKEWLGVNIDIERSEDLRGARASRLTGAQIRAARGLLRWSVMDLAKNSGVSRAIIRRLEEVDGPPAADEPALQMIETSLVDAGLEFVFPRSGKPGVRPR